MIELEDITDKNWRSKLSVSSSQKKMLQIKLHYWQELMLIKIKIVMHVLFVLIKFR